MDRLELPRDYHSHYRHRDKKDKEEEEEEERSEEVSSSSSSTISDGDLFQSSSRVSGVHTPQPPIRHHRRHLGDEEEENFSRNEKQDEPREGGDEDSYSPSPLSSLRNRRRRQKEREAEYDEDDERNEEDDANDENQGENLSWSEAVDLLFGTDPRKIWRLLNYSIIGLLFVSLTFLYFSSSSDKDRDLFLLFSGFILLLLLFAIVLNWYSKNSLSLLSFSSLLLLSLSYTKKLP